MMERRAERTVRADDGERGRYGCLGGLSDEIHKSGDGEDRTTAPEKSQ